MTTRRSFLQVLASAAAMLALPWKGKAPKAIPDPQYVTLYGEPINPPFDVRIRRGEFEVINDAKYGTVVVDDGGHLAIGPAVQKIEHLVVAGSVFGMPRIPDVSTSSVVALNEITILNTGRVA